MFKSYSLKEVTELTRNYKLLIILLAFALIGFSNPIFAKLTPEILATTGYQIDIPEPMLIDSWIQFYKNIATLLIIYIILFCANIPNELTNNSLINMVTRGLPRSTIILSKFTVISVLWIISYYLCFGITAIYSPLLLDGSLPNIFVASIFPAAFGILMISLMILGAITTKHIIGSLLVPFGFYGLSSILSINDQLAEYLPTHLMSSLSLITEEATISDYTIPLVITLMLISIIIAITITIFNKQSI